MLKISKNYLRGGMHTAEIFQNFQPLTRCDAHRRDCLRCGMHTPEIISSGAQMGLNHEKIGVENLVTHSL